MLSVEFREVEATECPLGPDWFEVDCFDMPLYFVFTNTQLSAHLSLELGSFYYTSPWLEKFQAGRTGLIIGQCLPLYKARDFFLLGKKADGSLYKADNYADFLKNLMSFGDEHVLLGETFNELQKIHEFEKLIPVGYRIVQSYNWY